MESTKTQKMVLAAMLAALGMILNLIEIPYPFAPWLNLGFIRNCRIWWQFQL